MSQSLGVLSQKFDLRSVELDPATALVLNFLHSLLELQLKPFLIFLFKFLQLFLASCLGAGQLSLQVLLLILRISLQGNVVICCRPQILLASVHFLLQVDYFRVSFVDDAEGLLELIVMTPELKGESVAVEVFLGLRFVDLVLRDWKKYN